MKKDESISSGPTSENGDHKLESDFDEFLFLKIHRPLCLVPSIRHYCILIFNHHEQGIAISASLLCFSSYRFREIFTKKINTYLLKLPRKVQLDHPTLLPETSQSERAMGSTTIMLESPHWFFTVRPSHDKHKTGPFRDGLPDLNSPLMFF